MNVPKLHHYVPQFYLKNFADEREQFWVWDKRTEKVFKTNSNGVAAGTHFYRVPEFINTDVDPLFLERDLSRLEGMAAQITQGWFDTLASISPMDLLPLSLDDRWSMSYFLSVQFLRTAEQRDILELFALEHGYYSEGISPEEKVNLHAYMLCKGRLVKDIAEHINKCIWVFARNSSDIPFWSSDNPTAFKTGDNRMWLKGPGIMSQGSYLVFPLSSTYILYCKEPTHWAKLKQFDCRLSPVQFTSGMVQHENAGQVFMARRFVISPTNDFIFATEFAKTIGTDIYSPENS
jgi:hypothetical protein